MKQCPQEIWNGMTTRSPGVRPATSRTDLLDDAHGLVAEDVARRHERAERLVQMQVRAADVRRRDLDDRVGGLLDDRVRDRLDADLASALPGDCSHVVRAIRPIAPRNAGPTPDLSASQRAIALCDADRSGGWGLGASSQASSSTSSSTTLPRAATTVRSTLAPGASVRSVQLPSPAKNRKWPVAEVGTSAVNSPRRVEQPDVRARDRLAAAQHAALDDGFLGDVDARRR